MKLGAHHSMLLHALPAYCPQISLCTLLKLGQIWLSLESHITDPCPKANKLVIPGIQHAPLGIRILKLEC